MSLRRPEQPLTSLESLRNLLKEHWIVIGEVLVIIVAYQWPSFGITGGLLRPEFFVSKCGVCAIFFINGLSLSIHSSPEDFLTATKTNTMIQLYNFAFIPLMAKLLVPHYPEVAFRDGLLALSLLPCTINVCVVQTLAAGGNVGTAIFNAIVSNVVGMLLTPLLSIWIMGAGMGVSFVMISKKLGNVIILPLLIGHVCRYTPIGKIAERVSGCTRTISSLLL